MTYIIDGTRGYELGYRIANDPNPPTPPILSPGYKFDCCNDFTWKVFTDETGTFDFSNDKSRIIYMFDAIFVSAEMKLQKNVDGTWTDQTVISDNTLGLFQDFGYFTSDLLKKYIELRVYWYNVWNEYGYGSYRFITTGTLATSGTVENISDTYCLNKYTPDSVDNTVRIEWYNNGIIADAYEDRIIKDYATLNSYGQIRVPGFFTFNNSKPTKEYTLYDEGQDVWTEDKQDPEYLLKINPMFFNAHQLIRNDILQADRILITDYNGQNTYNFIQKSVQWSNDYSPVWNFMKSKLAPIELRFKQEYNNSRKRRF